ncbi:MAG: hypothetical protein UGF89_06565 [Acutalibacteraceae bacterium]|nr:hypothetical protein [Acutalibacteraceae bacterium]
MSMKNEVCRGWKVPSSLSEAKIFASEVRKYAKKIEFSSDGVFRYERWQTKGGKIFILKEKNNGALQEIGWIHSQTKEYEPVWVKISA